MTAIARRTAVLAMAALAAAGAAGAPASRAATHSVVIDQLRFGTPPPGLRAGDTLVWVNKDMFDHTATARDGSFDVVVPAGGSVAVTLARAGTIEVYCRYHPGMAVTLTVAK